MVYITIYLHGETMLQLHTSIPWFSVCTQKQEALLSKCNY